jgi:type IV pilus assembly protein PilB
MPADELLMELGLTSEQCAGRTFYRGGGCDNCRSTGYTGRTAIFEIMLLDDTIRDLILSRSSTNVLREAARKGGMRTLRQSGMLAIFDGLTTIEEVVGETIADEQEG